MNNYHRFKKGELVWCNLYPGVYIVDNVKNREKKGQPYSDLLTLILKFSAQGNHNPIEIMDELHCEKLDVGIKQCVEQLNETINELNSFLNEKNL